MPRTPKTNSRLIKSVKTISIKATRVAMPPGVYHVPCTGPRTAQVMISALTEGLDREQFWVIPVDVRNKPLGIAVAGSGSADSCPVDVREVFRPAVILNASAIIVAHNHPSGDSEPSEDDLKLTKRLIEAGNLLGVPVLDQLIVTEVDDFTSLRGEACELWG